MRILYMPYIHITNVNAEFGAAFNPVPVPRHLQPSMRTHAMISTSLARRQV